MAIDTDQIRIRDPYVVVDAENKLYYMYCSSSVKDADGQEHGGVVVYKSKDLTRWDGPYRVFTIPSDNWITGRVWAPEVHEYQGKYYLFATLNSSLQWKRKGSGVPYTFRGTQIFWADSPEGPFKPFDRFPHTPMDQMALDGTLYVEDGVPYMVYCHEWVEITDGGMNLIRLKPDLSGVEGSPLRLFYGSAAPWTSPINKYGAYVTDGCFLYKTKKGKLLMLWSSHTPTGYGLGISESVTGKFAGPWKHHEKALFSKNGGHGMIFKDLEGKLRMVLHCPNVSPNERAVFFELEDTGDSLILK